MQFSQIRWDDDIDDDRRYRYDGLARFVTHRYTAVLLKISIYIINNNYLYSAPKRRNGSQRFPSCFWIPPQPKCHPGVQLRVYIRRQNQLG